MAAIDVAAGSSPSGIQFDNFPVVSWLVFAAAPVVIVTITIKTAERL